MVQLGNSVLIWPYLRTKESTYLRKIIIIIRCEMIEITDYLYQKEHPPLKKETHAAKVTVNVSIFMIGNFDERLSRFDAKFQLKLQW